MRIKKLTPLVVALALTACAGDTTTDTEEANQEPEVTEEAVTEKNTGDPVDEESVEEAEDEESAGIESDPNFVPEYRQIIEPVEQSVQQEPGEVEKDNYFKINGLLGDYEQTGDPFIVNHQYDQEKRILIIPIHATNKYEQAANISTLTISELNLVQEDENSIYQCTTASAVPEEYKNDVLTKIKVGGESDYYLAYEIEKEELDFKLVSGLGEHIVFANIKNQ